MALPSFIFDGQTANESPDSIRRKRALVEKLLRGGDGGSAPRNVGEGIYSIGKSIAGGITGHRLNKEASQAEARYAAQQDALARQLVGGGNTAGSGGGFGSGGGSSDSTGSQSGWTPPAPGAAGPFNSAGIDPRIGPGLIDTAKAIGIDPLDLATTVSYETAGTFDPTKRGPTTQWGQHRGLIQFGQPQARQHGVNWDDPVGSQLGPNGAVASYLRSSGVKPGMGLLDVYSAINAGAPGLYNRTDANNGGAPGTVRDKVERQMPGHREKARQLLAPYLGTRGDQGMPDEAAMADSNMPQSDMAGGDQETRRDRALRTEAQAMDNIRGIPDAVRGFFNPRPEGSPNKMPKSEPGRPMFSVNWSPPEAPPPAPDSRRGIALATEARAMENLRGVPAAMGQFFSPQPSEPIYETPSDPMGGFMPGGMPQVMEGRIPDRAGPNPFAPAMPGTMDGFMPPEMPANAGTMMGSDGQSGDAIRAMAAENNAQEYAQPLPYEGVLPQSRPDPAVSGAPQSSPVNMPLPQPRPANLNSIQTPVATPQVPMGSQGPVDYLADGGNGALQFAATQMMGGPGRSPFVPQAMQQPAPQGNPSAPSAPQTASMTPMGGDQAGGEMRAQVPPSGSAQELAIVRAIGAPAYAKWLLEQRAKANAPTEYETRQGPNGQWLQRPKNTGGAFTPVPGSDPEVPKDVQDLNRRNAERAQKGEPPIDSNQLAQEKAARAVIGEQEAKIAANAPSSLQTAKDAAKEIDALIAHPSNNNNWIGSAIGATGKLARAIPGSPEYGFNARLEQIKGRVFLEAFNGLRGGGAITKEEGEKATNALARLDAAQNYKDFNAAMIELRGMLKNRIAETSGIARKYNTVPGVKDGEQDPWDIGDGKPTASAPGAQSGPVRQVPGSEGLTAAPGSPVPSSAPTATATNPKTGQKLGLINGQWVPLK